MPPGPGGVIDAAINIHAGDFGRTINATAIVVHKARHHPSRPRSGGRQQTQQLRIRQRRRQLGGGTKVVGVGELVHRQEEGLLTPFQSSLAAAANTANVNVPGGEEVSAVDAINEEYREPPHPQWLVVIRWRSG